MRVAIVLATAIGSLAAGVAAMTGELHSLLDYRRVAILEGEWWALATGHLMHANAGHATTNLAALLVIAWTFRPEVDDRVASWIVCVGMTAIDVGLWFFHPEVERYVGLSGVLHAWFVAGAALWVANDRDDRRLAWGATRRGWGIALIAIVVVKLLLETTGRAWWSDSLGIPVVTAAHRWGAAAGVVVALAVIARTRRLVVTRGAAVALPAQPARGDQERA